MATLSHVFSAVAAPGESSATFRSKRDQEVTITVSGTIDADCALVLERTDGRGGWWKPIARWAAGAQSVSYGFTGDGWEWRFRAEVAEEATLTELTVGLADVVRDLQIWRDNDGGVAAKVTDEGIEAKKITVPQLAATLIGVDGLIVDAAGVVLFGDMTTVGSWRITRSGDDLLVQRYEGSPTPAWVTKLTIQAAGA